MYNWINVACSLFSFLNTSIFHLRSSRLLSVLCCNLDSFLLLESQYNLTELLLQGQRDNVTEPPSGEGWVTNSDSTVTLLFTIGLYSLNVQYEHTVETLCIDSLYCLFILSSSSSGNSSSMDCLWKETISLFESVQLVVRLRGDFLPEACRKWAHLLFPYLLTIL